MGTEDRVILELLESHFDLTSDNPILKLGQKVIVTGLGGSAGYYPYKIGDGATAYNDLDFITLTLIKTAADFTSDNPVLFIGQWGYEIDTGYMKAGDGSTAWISLSYSAGGKITDLIVTNGITVPVMHVQDQKGVNVDGGTFTLGSYLKRDLNEVLTNTIVGASLSSNQITLPAGTYKTNASAPAYRVKRHVLRLYNVTDAATEIWGMNAFSEIVDNNIDRAFLMGIFTIDGTKVLEIQHRCETTKTGNGFGVGSASQISNAQETYADVFIEKIG